MRQRLGSAVIILLLASSSRLFARERHSLGAAQWAYVFSTSANAQGRLGEFFKTRMVITNPDRVPLSVHATLFPAGGGPTPPTAVIALQPYETKVFENFLADVFGYTGGAGIGLSSFDGNGKMIVTAEVYVEGASGRYSTPLTGLTGADRISASGLDSFVVGLRADSSNRANFGCSNAGSAEGTVRADFYGPANPDVPYSVDLVLPAYGWTQQAVPVQGSPIRIVFRAVTSLWQGAGPLCYGVNVNNDSGDGIWIPAVLWDPWAY
jgi:hypothetical protein